ncbi:Tat pathway signal sequence domain protein [Streptomyces yerevanensis]|uniref:Tat pathway signal sequence domain protein n=1 Tax=Streptomyces yerevanensis TaxID=66378 RepID=UPI000A587C79|nr:Tat pathway signal sequence domain protein [Streptomyces yerevanensis]
MNERAKEPRAKEPRGKEQRIALRRLFAGTALAVAGTAAMVAVTLPMEASGNGGPPQTRGEAAPHAAATPSPSTTDTGNASGNTSGNAGTGAADPLTDDEITRAQQAALAGDRTLRTTSEDVQGEDGTPQFLTADLTDLTAESSGREGERHADVFFYDYRDDRFVKKTVDLGTGKVVRTDSATGVQPAPSGQESREALKVLLASPLGEGVRQDFQAATGRPLAAPAQLRVQGLVYERSGTAGPADCDGAHRCVRLFTRVVGGPWIDTRQFVIDLSARTAHRLP